MSQPRPSKLHRFYAILIWWHSPFKEEIIVCSEMYYQFLYHRSSLQTTYLKGV